MSLKYLSDLKPRTPVFEIGVEGPVGYTGAYGEPGGIGTCGNEPSENSEYIANSHRFSLDVAPKIKEKLCSICCGKGKVEKQGWFGRIKLVACKCKRSTR